MAKKLNETQIASREALVQAFDALGPISNNVFIAAKSLAHDKPLLHVNNYNLYVDTPGIFGTTKNEHIRFCSTGDSVNMWVSTKVMGADVPYTEGYLQFDNTKDITWATGFDSSEFDMTGIWDISGVHAMFYIEDAEKIMTDLDVSKHIDMLKAIIDDPNNGITKEVLAQLIPIDATMADWRAVRAEELERRAHLDITMQDVIDVPEQAYPSLDDLV